MNLIPNLALSIIVTAAGCGAALAQPANTTKYKYYLVDGKSASEVRNAMVRNGPRQRGAKGYALTTVVTTRARNLVQEKTCQTDRYQLNLEFTITLPKMRNENALPAADHLRWQQFSSFVKKHEETHRSIWLACAADLERQVKSIKLVSCAAAEAKTQKLRSAMRSTCEKRNAAFDAAEMKKLAGHPFIRLAHKSSSQQVASKAP